MHYIIPEVINPMERGNDHITYEKKKQPNTNLKIDKLISL